MKNLEDLFEHELRDLYSAENQLIHALPKMASNAKDKELKTAFEKHLEETKGHKKRLEEVCAKLGINPSGEDCMAMKGIIAQAEQFLAEDSDGEVRDAGLIAEAQRAEHYEISVYGTVIRYAKELGHKDLVDKLVQTLQEEYGADESLNKMAENRLNRKAK